MTFPDRGSTIGAVAQPGVPMREAAPVMPDPSDVAGASERLEITFVPQRFDVTTELRLDVVRRRVFDALLQPAPWWPRIAGRGTVVVEPRVGGRFYRDCGDGCGTLLGHVSRLIPPEMFAIQGSLGLEGIVWAAWQVHLAPLGRGTVLTGVLRGFGDLDDETRRRLLAEWDAVYAALAEYLNR